jgi:hypothetical protein
LFVAAIEFRRTLDPRAPIGPAESSSQVKQLIVAFLVAVPVVPLLAAPVDPRLATPRT